MVCGDLTVATKTTLSKEDRERNRQILLGEIESACQADREERDRERQKKVECRSDLLDQMNYNDRRRQEDRDEEARMLDKQKQSEEKLQEEVFIFSLQFQLSWLQLSWAEVH